MTIFERLPKLTKLINWYNLAMSIQFPVSVAKQQFGALVDRAHLADEAIYLTKHGRRVAVIVDAARYEEMLEQIEDAQDAEDAKAALQSMEGNGETPIPWEEVKADLGIS